MDGALSTALRRRGMSLLKSQDIASHLCPPGTKPGPFKETAAIGRTQRAKVPLAHAACPAAAGAVAPERQPAGSQLARASANWLL
jgi:hypothetical protein